MRAVWLPALLAWACTGRAPDTAEETDGQDGACGEVSTWDVEVRGMVVDTEEVAVHGAAVQLEDRGWEAGTVLGTATTDDDGLFTLGATGVTSVEGCWGTVLDYVLVATEGGRTGSKDVNSHLFHAIDGGTLVADISTFPLVIE